MTALILRSRQAPSNFLETGGMYKQYSLLGEYYEENSNVHGGVDYSVKDLERHLKTHKPGTEHGTLNNFAENFAQMQIFSLLLPHKSSADPYILKTYLRYRVYVRK